MQFKTGDKVKLIRNSSFLSNTYSIGEIGEIKDMFTLGRQTEYKIRFTDKEYWFTKNNFKLNKYNENTL